MRSSRTSPVECTPLYDLDFETDFAPLSGAGATLAVVDQSGNGVLSVTGRTDTWNAPRTPVGEVEPGVEYELSAMVFVPVESQVRLIAYDVDGPNEYNWLGNVTVPANEWTEISGLYTFSASGASTAWIGVEVAAVTDYFVDDFLVKPESCDTTPEIPDPGTIVLQTSFEESLDGWVPREAGAGPHSIERTDAFDAADGDWSVRVFDRASQGSGLGVDVTDILMPGVQYQMTVSLRFDDGAPTDDIVLSGQLGSSFVELGRFEAVGNDGWAEVTATFTLGSFTSAFLYFETNCGWDNTAGECTGTNTSTFFVDDVTVMVAVPPSIEDLPPLKDSLPFPLGVAIDSRETVGSAADLLRLHFDQITAENHMKPDYWYDGAGNFSPDPEIAVLMDFATDNNLRMYGHVLVWHSQTPAWFFEDGSGNPLTNDPADQVLLLQRMENHIFDVAEYLSQWGEFGGDNPLVAFDVVNEVISDGSGTPGGMRTSRWFEILGEEFVDAAFEFAQEAFNEEYAASGAVDPVTLFINEYNTEFSAKRDRYVGLVERLIDRGAPIHGVGHQFHVNLSIPISSLEAALQAFQGTGLTQAVTEFDVTTGTPVTEALLIEQGYYYRDAFNLFRSYEDDLYSVTVWGLFDTRSWRSGDGDPLIFDGDLQGKPAYYGILDSEENPLPELVRSANAFRGSVAVSTAGFDAIEWDQLPRHSIGTVGDFQMRWDTNHLTAFVSVEDPTAGMGDGVEFQIGGGTFTVARDGTSAIDAIVREVAGGYEVLAHVPFATPQSQGNVITFDARIVNGGTTAGWNSAGSLGSVTLVEPLSFLQVVRASDAPSIDGVVEGVWDQALTVTTGKAIQGAGSASADVRTLWKDSMLYILMEVTDDGIYDDGSDPWTQDSVEIYVDTANAKNGSYRNLDMQLRVNAFNEVSFGAGDATFQANRVTTATSINDDGYIVEVAIDLFGDSGLGTFHGIDFQVNDATGATRTGIRNWADPTGLGYQSTARWGVGQLIGGAPGSDDEYPLPLNKLTDDNKGPVWVTKQASPGDTVVVFVGTDHEGDTVNTFMYSTPVLIGTTTVSSTGMYTVVIPSSATLGSHTIAVYDADGAIIGWDTIVLVLSSDGLALTGIDVTVLLLAAFLLLAVGATLVVVARRPERPLAAQ